MPLLCATYASGTTPSSTLLPIDLYGCETLTHSEEEQRLRLSVAQEISLLHDIKYKDVICMQK